VFSDILVIPEAMGQQVDYPEGGPTLRPALAHGFDPDALVPDDVSTSLGYVYEAIRLLRREMGDDRAVLGFAGAPYSLASYMVEGGGSRHNEGIKSLLYRDPERGVALLDRIADVVLEHLELQVAAGADAVQLFDTWAGGLNPEDYVRFALPPTRRIFDGLARLGVQRILFINGMAGVLEHAATAGADVLSVDWRTDLPHAGRIVGEHVSLQGNLDPVELFGPPERIRARVRALHRDLGRNTGHVFNLGHGILPQTPVEGAEAFVRAVHELSDGGT
jgi:uroporphyrinogen decarboxylase